MYAFFHEKLRKSFVKGYSTKPRITKSEIRELHRIRRTEVYFKSKCGFKICRKTGLGYKGV